MKGKFVIAFLSLTLIVIAGCVEEDFADDFSQEELETIPGPEVEMVEQNLSYGTKVGNRPASRAVVGLAFGPTTSEYRCTGSLVADRWILTAGHCIPSGATSGQVRVHTFDNEGEPKGGWYDHDNNNSTASRPFPDAYNGFATFIVHDDFDQQGPGLPASETMSANDVALVRISGTFNGIDDHDRLALADRDVWQNLNVNLYGRGYSSHSGNQGGLNYLRMLNTDINYLDPSSGNNVKRFRSEASPGGPCIGDSGGPAVREVLPKNGYEPPIQVGVFSASFNVGATGCPNSSNGFSRWTAVGEKVDWIVNTIESQDPHIQCQSRTSTSYTNFQYKQCFTHPHENVSNYMTVSCTADAPCDSMEPFDCDYFLQINGEPVYYSESQVNGWGYSSACALGTVCLLNSGSLLNGLNTDDTNIRTDADICVDVDIAQDLANQL